MAVDLTYETTLNRLEITETRIGRHRRTVRTAEVRRALVVEDHADTSAAIALFLEQLGYEVHEARTGLHAVEKARLLLPQLILMDIDLPALDGLEAARRIRRLALASPPLIIATTGWGDPQHRIDSELAGIDVHLTKPLDLEALGRLIAPAEESAEEEE